MRYIKITLVVCLFIFIIPLLASSQNEKEEAIVISTTKKELMQAWFEKVLESTVTKGFPSVPIISPFADWDYYYLREQISWEPEAVHRNNYKAIKVPPGFVTDLASIPKAFWSILPPTQRYTQAAIIHDYLYWTQTVSRDVADEILKIGMKELGVQSWKVDTIYKAVRTFGGSAWEENAKLKAQGEKRFLKKYPTNSRVTWEEWKKSEGVFAN